MNNIELAKECGAQTVITGKHKITFMTTTDRYIFDVCQLQAFVDAIEARFRERCVPVCIELPKIFLLPPVKDK